MYKGEGWERVYKGEGWERVYKREGRGEGWEGYTRRRGEDVQGGEGGEGRERVLHVHVQGDNMHMYQVHSVHASNKRNGMCTLCIFKHM